MYLGNLTKPFRASVSLAYWIIREAGDSESEIAEWREHRIQHCPHCYLWLSMLQWTLSHKVARGAKDPVIENEA
jgi:hypothetical protein